MYDTIIRGGTLVTEEELIPNRCLAVSKGKICFPAPGERATAREVIDAAGLYTAPGLIDLHVHGGDGADALDGDPDSLERISFFHARRGTTGILPTIASASPEQMTMALTEVAEYAGRERGALILGSHLEGPYLNTSFQGALDAGTFRQPNLKEMEELLASGQGALKMVTLAPELPGGLELVEALSSSGVIPSLGHSGASFAETQAAGQAGLIHITHLFNAMAGLHHREPGPAGAALSTHAISASAIADGIHVHPFILKMLWQLKKDQMILISDAILATGLPDGRYLFAGQEISVGRGRAVLPSGRLTGSTITLLDAVKNMVALVGLTIPQAVRLASTNPARLLGLSAKGRVAAGYDADLVLLDAGLSPVVVMVGGGNCLQKRTLNSTPMLQRLFTL